MRFREEDMRVAGVGVVHAPLATESSPLVLIGCTHASSHGENVLPLEGYWPSYATPRVGADSMQAQTQGCLAVRVPLRQTRLGGLVSDVTRGIANESARQCRGAHLFRRQVES